MQHWEAKQANIDSSSVDYSIEYENSDSMVTLR